MKPSMFKHVKPFNIEIALIFVQRYVLYEKNKSDV